MADKTLEQALDYLSREARESVLDSVYCQIFNLANTLDGNTEVSDLDYLAGLIFAYASGHTQSEFERSDAATQEHWRRIARATLTAMPHLYARIEHRMRAHATVLAELAQAERLAKQKAR